MPDLAGIVVGGEGRLLGDGVPLRRGKPKTGGQKGKNPACVAPSVVGHMLVSTPRACGDVMFSKSIRLLCRIAARTQSVKGVAQIVCFLHCMYLLCADEWRGT